MFIMISGWWVYRWAVDHCEYIVFTSTHLYFPTFLMSRYYSNRDYFKQQQ